MNDSSSLTSTSDNPVVVEVWRGSAVESRHRGAAAVVDSRGDVLMAIGDIDVAIYPRSALKPLQALAFAESGAISRFRLDDSLLCLACASHNGESRHTTRVATWLQSIGLDGDALECGAHYPYAEGARNELIRADARPLAVHNNCSGKHAGYLSVARSLGIDHRGYIHPEHAVQERVTAAIEETCGIDLQHAEPAVDGCGVPVYGVPLARLARAFAGFSPMVPGGGRRAEARGAIVEAIVRHPDLIAGTGRFCSRVIGKAAGLAIVKTGAEGVFTGTLLKQGIGIALKIDDGATRAAEVLMASLLKRFCNDPDFAADLDDEVKVTLRNVVGRDVGRILVAGTGQGDRIP